MSFIRDVQRANFINESAYKFARDVLDAIDVGRFEIKHLPNQPDRIAVHIIYGPNDEYERIYKGEAGTGEYDFWKEDEFAVKVDSFDYVVFDRPDGDGTDGIFDLSDEFVRQQRRMQAEADDDPEGAFGGRGNNMPGIY